MEKTYRVLLAVGGLALVGSTLGCVSHRPSRNGVFNENQYVRKEFLVQPAAATTPDPGWMMRNSITAVSTPNPLGSGVFQLAPAITWGAELVRFRVTPDKLEMLNIREIAAPPAGGDPQRTEEVLNVWPVTNVDLKYRINLDGETTNFLEENQELNWEMRQWVKLKFAKNDMSDLALMGAYYDDMITKCTDSVNATAELVPGTFQACPATPDPNNPNDGCVRPDGEEHRDMLQWTVQIMLPLLWNDATCVASYEQMGINAARLGKDYATFNLTTSLIRAKTMDQVTYKPVEIAEKDPIRHKYLPLEYTITESRDPDTGLLAARDLLNRYDPQKPIVWYFDPGFPAQYKSVFTGPKGVKEQTNKIFETAGVAARVDFKEPTDGLPAGQSRMNGDIRYNFLNWINDRDTSEFFLGVTSFATDPRTGEIMSSEIGYQDYFGYAESSLQQIDVYLKSIGSSLDINSPTPWADGPANCKDGDTMPLVPDTVVASHNGNSSVYGKMQQYLQKPIAQYGNLGPQDFIAKQDDDFFRAYFALIPYQIYSDPDANPYVIREGGAGVYGPAAMWKRVEKERQFQEAAAKIDRGETPYEGSGPDGLKNATAFLNNFRDLTLAHKDYQYAKFHANRRVKADAPDAFSFVQMASTLARRCVGTPGKWQSKKEWVDGMLGSFWNMVMFHEFGHSLGMDHNFMASVDKNNFPHVTDGAGRDHIGFYASSVMEYTARIADWGWSGGWAPYDKGAIGWLYAGNGNDGTPPSTSITGQVSATSPWKDPFGFQADGKTEIPFLLCGAQHILYTPLCRPYDLGSTPSQIVANQIDEYEWQYRFSNFRAYRKFWNESAYASRPAGLIVDLRKFLSMRLFDWAGAQLADDFRRIGVTNPDMNGSDLQYYTSLTNKFNKEISAANQMVAAFHKAIIQQSSGERPYRTIYDKFYGDVTQQGIILDKLFAMQGFVALWPTDNYNPNDAGSYVSSYGEAGDSSYQYVAEDAVTSMIGGQYDVYPYFVPLAVAQFAQDTHSPSFSGRIDVRDWIGGHVFYRLQDFLDYFRDIAVQNNFPGCSDIRNCSFDPRAISDTHNEFLGPDKRLWIWAYVIDRNQWVAVQKERNTASYIIVRNYTDDVVNQLDDGAFPGGAYQYLLPMKYFLDSFNYYN